MVYRYNKAPTQRQLRVSESIKHIISEIFVRNDLSLPIFENMFVSVSEVRISPDLKMATAFVSSINKVDENEMIKFLNNVAPEIRHIIGKNLNLRCTPEIRFIYDKSFDDAAKIEAILQNTRSE